MTVNTPALIPRKELFGNPERFAPKLSPDGERVAFLAPRDEVMNVWIQRIGDDTATAVSRDERRGIQAFFFAHDGRHLLWLQDRDGDENWCLFGIDLGNGSERTFTPFPGVQTQVVAIDKHFPDEILLALNKDDPELHDLYRFRLSSGALERIAVNPGYSSWLVDCDFRVRGGVRPRADGGHDVEVSRNIDSNPELVISFDLDDALTSTPYSFTRDGKGLYLLSSKDASAGQLVLLNLATLETQVIAGDLRYDVSGYVQHPDTYEIQLVTFDRDRRDLLVLDPSIAEDIERFRALHPGDAFPIEFTLAFHSPDVLFQRRDDADRRWLVCFTADNDAMAYYLYDRETKQGRHLFDARPALRDYTLASMEPFSFTTRDGLEVHGYVTVPPGAERRALPTVLKVHGGPWFRDYWGYDPTAQWLANRGYLCVSINFRGSTGYGKDFTNAGDREWAGKMHDDLVDGLRFVIDRGWTDPKRVGIYGGSYGGYAALVGATFTPDVFRCAIAAVAPSNLKTLIESLPPYWSTALSLFKRRVGDPETEADFLWSRSPLSRVGDIRIPMLVAQGANDPRVKQAESEQIVEAMHARGIDHEYVLFPDEGHAFVRPENRLRFYEVAERFLARHLGGRMEE